jgi:hypothetical protein
MLALDIPDPSDEQSVADWVELCVSYEGTALVKAALSHKVEMAIGKEPGDDFISSVWDELETRMNLYGEHPPYIVYAQEVTPNLNWKESPEYVMCLVLSLIGNPIDPTPTGKLFERISREAVKNYLNGEAIVTGHPAQYSIVDVCALMREGFKSELPQGYKDRGVDVIAWKPVDNVRGNQIVILMQCAGGHNWISKTGDVVERAWTEKYITFGAYPVRGFSTAVIVPHKKFEEVSFETNLLFDRARIYKYIINTPLEGTLRQEVLGWCNNIFTEILD